MQSRLICLGSSSHGNGFILDCDGQQLIIECGVPFKECNKALNGDISGVQGCIVTHCHSDHSKYVIQYRQHGIEVYLPYEEIKPDGDVIISRYIPKFRIGGFQIVELSVPHGDCDCFSYIIDTPDGQRIVFATDLTDWPYFCKGVNHVMLECNYSEELRLEALMKNPDIRSASSTHMELSACIKVLNRLKSPSLQSVTLLHLSDGLSDAEGFKQRIFEETGIKAEVAESGSVFSLDKHDF